MPPKSGICLTLPFGGGPIWSVSNLNKKVYMVVKLDSWGNSPVFVSSVSSSLHGSDTAAAFVLESEQPFHPSFARSILSSRPASSLDLLSAGIEEVVRQKIFSRQKRIVELVQKLTQCSRETRNVQKPESSKHVWNEKDLVMFAKKKFQEKCGEYNANRIWYESDKEEFVLICKAAWQQMKKEGYDLISSVSKLSQRISRYKRCKDGKFLVPEIIENFPKEELTIIIREVLM